MHFAKRLRSEADRKWLNHYIDYKLLKRSIRQDVDALDAHGSSFSHQLKIELEKVAVFYAEQESTLESHLQTLIDNQTTEQLAAFHAEVQDLRKYVVLNYIAVVKAVKKRNRHLRTACGMSTPAIRAADILATQHFFTSVRLAAMATRTEIFAQEQMQSTQQQTDVLQGFSCPICLNPLRSPVVLSCAHRFCWGCLVSLASTLQRSGLSQYPAITEKDSDKDTTMHCDGTIDRRPSSPTTVVKPAVWESEVSDDDTATLATFACPCCRKEQFILDLDKLQVDPHLDAFMQRLEQQHTTTTTTITADQRSNENKDVVLSMRLKTPAVPINSNDIAAAHQVDVPPQSLKEVPRPLLAASETTNDQQQQPMDIVPPSPFVSQPPTHTAPECPVSGDKPLLPPLPPSLQQRLTICLDLDGTLVTTFTPKRAPTLPPAAVSYIVGKGGSLNPGGVFVVERPGLGNFLQRISTVAEVVIFTAGLEDYASPICDEIERRYGKFDYRLYRPATVPSDVYPCIKDLSRLGRDIRRCVLVDDTPLAFFRQPDNGIPVLQFRGDIDDRMLEEAIGPLLEALVHEPDVTRALARRFNMKRWFAAQGLPAYSPQKPQQQYQQQQQHRRNVLHRAPSVPAMRTSSITAPNTSSSSMSNTLHGFMLVCDFDKTLMDCDTGETLCDHLAPELTSLLTQVESHAPPQQQQQLPTYIPVTNTVLSEMQRRGISQDQIYGALRSMATEALPSSIINMMKASHQRNVDLHILSDANSLFIGSILAAAQVNHCVKSVITNPARFETITMQQNDDVNTNVNTNASSSSTTTTGWFFGMSTSSSNNTNTKQQHRLVITPRHDHATMGHHGCPFCPSNLCKGRELELLRSKQQSRRRVIYCGDGANDFCAAVRLDASDIVLARGGYPLEKLLNHHRESVRAQVVVWNTHDELAEMIHGIAMC